MATTAADATAAPFRIRDLEVFPIGITQYGRFERWMKQQIIDQARESIRGQGLSKSEQDSIVEHAYLDRDDMTFGSFRGLKHLSSVEGMVYLVYLSCQKGNPDLSLEEMEARLDDGFTLDQIEEIVNKVLEISGLSNDDQKKMQKASGRKKKKRKT